jgi:DNA adenine methylase
VCRRFDQKKALHYLDPPYFGVEKYYKEVFTKEDHYRLAKMAHELIGQVVISYYPVPEILELYPEEKWERRYFEARSSLSNTAKGGHRESCTEMLLIKR